MFFKEKPRGLEAVPKGEGGGYRQFLKGRRAQRRTPDDDFSLLPAPSPLLTKPRELT